jgi:lysophospholipase L1-like esterase
MIVKRFVAALALMAAIGVGWVGTARAGDGVTYYLALGDSLSQGYQPIGGSPFGDGYNQGYADQLLKLVRKPAEHLQLVKLGCGSETTTTMLFGGSPFCGYPGPQLAAAAAFLRAHRGEVAFVTIDIAGIDVLDPAGGGVAAIQANLPVILAGLRDAAGPGVPIVGMSYYSPTLPSVWAETHDLQAVEARLAGLVAFNDLLGSIYAVAGDPVADVEGAFDSTDTTLVDGVPADVARLCAWTRLCTPPPLGPDLHPNDAGYAAIAAAFARALPETNIYA